MRRIPRRTLIRQVRWMPNGMIHLAIIFVALPWALVVGIGMGVREALSEVWGYLNAWYYDE